MIFHKGDIVEVRYKNLNSYYAGIITNVNEDNTCDIKYSDGEEELKVSEHMILLLNHTTEVPVSQIDNFLDENHNIRPLKLEKNLSSPEAMPSPNSHHLGNLTPETALNSRALNSNNLIYSEITITNKIDDKELNLKEENNNIIDQNWSKTCILDSPSTTTYKELVNIKKDSLEVKLSLDIDRDSINKEIFIRNEDNQSYLENSGVVSDKNDNYKTSEIPKGENTNQPIISGTNHLVL